MIAKYYIFTPYKYFVEKMTYYFLHINQKLNNIGNLLEKLKKYTLST